MVDHRGWDIHAARHGNQVSELWGRRMSATAADPYVSLRNGLIWGRGKSGERQIPQHLTNEVGCTSSDLREALLRLVGVGLIVFQRNPGFRAVASDQGTFRRPAHLRLLLEQEGVALALRHGNFEWEMPVTAACRKLTHVEIQMMAVDDVTQYICHWSIHDREFHCTVREGCTSDLLLCAYKTAFDTFRMCNVAEKRNYRLSHRVTAGEHRAIYDAVSAHDTDQLATALEAHLSLLEDGNRSSDPPPLKM